MGTVVQTEDEVDRLMDACDDAVALLLDTGHLTFAGGDPARARVAPCRRASRTCTARMCAATVLDRSLNRDSSFLDAVLDGVFTVPGDGSVDYAAVLAPIARAGIAAGSWSRRSRTRASRRPPNTRTSAIATCAASPTPRPGDDAEGRTPRIRWLRARRCSCCGLSGLSPPRPVTRA